MSFKELEKYSNELAKVRIKCPCSHTMYFPVYAPDIQICSHCGNKVYRNERVKFKDLLLKEIKLGGVSNG